MQWPGDFHVSELSPAHPQHRDTVKLSWEETAREVVAAHESWEEWEVTVGDGLAALPWEPNTTKRRDRRQRERE